MSAAAPRATPQANKAQVKSFLGHPLDPFKDPWYRFDRVISTLSRHVAIRPGATWLDLGCQLGQFIQRLRATHSIVATGIDDFEKADAVEVARRYFGIELADPSAAMDASWRYLCRSIDKSGLAVDGEKFDFISALEILEHMVDTDRFLEECRRHLAPGGHLVISTPNINSLRNRLQVPFGVYPAGMEYRTVIHHVRLYNAAALRSHVEEHGFRLVAMAGVSLMPARLLRHGLLRRIDAWLADRLPSLCGNLIAIFQASQIEP